MGEDIKQNPIQISAEILKKCIYVIGLVTSVQISICESLKSKFCQTVFSTGTLLKCFHCANGSFDLVARVTLKASLG